LTTDFVFYVACYSVSVFDTFLYHTTQINGFPYRPVGDHRSPDLRRPRYIHVDPVQLQVPGCPVRRSGVVVEEAAGVILRQRDLVPRSLYCV